MMMVMMMMTQKRKRKKKKDDKVRVYMHLRYIPNISCFGGGFEHIVIVFVIIHNVYDHRFQASNQ